MCTRYCPKKKEFTAGGKWLEGDSEVSREKLTEKEFRIAMCETQQDFYNKILPTLSFQLQSELGGIRHSDYKKEMRSQVLTH